MSLDIQSQTLDTQSMTNELPHQVHPDLYSTEFHTRHYTCQANDSNPQCPTGLHTRVPLLAVGQMLATKCRKASLMPYALNREGGKRPLDLNFATLAEALQWVGQSLYDNGYLSKGDAQRFSATVKPDGAPVTREPYTFTLTKVTD